MVIESLSPIPLKIMVAILIIYNKGQGQHNCMTSFSFLCLLLHLYIQVYNMQVLYTITRQICCDHLIKNSRWLPLSTYF